MRVTATEAKNRFGSLCAQAKREPVFVEKEGQLDTVIISAEHYYALQTNHAKLSHAARKKKFEAELKTKEEEGNKVIAEAKELAVATGAIKEDDWNEYRILAEGPRIRSWINGVPALDYTETEPRIAADGLIGIQIHSGGMALVQVKDVSIEVLPPTPGAVTWEQVGLPPPPPPKEKNAKKKSASAAPAQPAPAPASKSALPATKTGRDIDSAITSCRKLAVVMSFVAAAWATGS